MHLPLYSEVNDQLAFAVIEGSLRLIYDSVMTIQPPLVDDSLYGLITDLSEFVQDYEPSDPTEKMWYLGEHCLNLGDFVIGLYWYAEGGGNGMDFEYSTYTPGMGEAGVEEGSGAESFMTCLSELPYFKAK